MNRDAETRGNGARSADEIEEHIRATQEELRRTIEGIGESLSVSEIAEAAAHYARAGPGEFAANLGRSVRDNPIAVSLLGAGLAWLTLSPESKEAATTATGSSAREAADKSQKTVRAAQSAADRVRQLAREQPVLVATAGMLAGAAIAAALPASEAEERMLGSRAGGAIEEAAREAADVARGAAEGMRQGLEGEGAAERGDGRAGA